MKGYGLPRHPDLDAPDLVDISYYALKTSTGALRGKGGDFRGSTKRKNRNSNRRYWKKRERSIVKRDIYDMLH